MIASAPKKETRLAMKNRREEIEQRLAAVGLARGPRRLFRGESPFGFEEDRTRRLRHVLEGLGPIFSSFGLYMSSRVDLWPAKECLELARVPDRGPETPPSVVRQLLTREIDGLSLEGFDEFQTKPFESRLLFQVHHARLNNGTEVVVKVIHPEAESHLRRDVDLLLLLKDSFAGGLSGSAFNSAVADFGHSLDRQLDFVHEARAFETLAEDAEEYDALRAPRVYRALCTSKVLTMEKLDGLRLANILPSPGDSGTDAYGSPSLRGTGFEPEEFARLLCEVWLRQALMGRCFPVEPNPENVLVLPGKQIAFTGGAFAVLALEPQANLWSYLLAAANENSDSACSFLLKEMRKEGGSLRDDELRQRFRQAMPFRDGGWDLKGDCRGLAELLFVQWRFATECRYQPLMHLPAFFRGLFGVANVARLLAPQADSLTEGMRNLRLLSGLAHFTKLFDRRQLADQMDRYAAMMMELPQSFDEALTSVSEGPPRLKLQVAESADHRGGLSSSWVVAALVLLLAGVVLLSHYITSSVVTGAWANRINTIVFLIFGAMLLRAANQVR